MFRIGHVNHPDHHCLRYAICCLLVNRTGKLKTDSTCEHWCIGQPQYSLLAVTTHTTSICLPCSGPGVNKQYLLLIVSGADAVGVVIIKQLFFSY